MKTTNIKHVNVLPNGTFLDQPGAINVKGGMRMSVSSGGCGMLYCDCSPGHWLTTMNPRTDDGVVTGTRIDFENKKEMDRYLADHFIERI